MKKLSITVVHRLPNRVRLKLSAPIKDIRNFYSNMKNNLQFLELRYNKVLKTIILRFEPSEIFLQEIIYRTAISFSIENGLMPVKIVEEHEYKSISPLSMYALGSIIVSSINMIFNKNDEKLQNSMNMFSMGLTVGSVFEHAYGEVKRRGMFDIEVLPALYLLKSFFTEQKLSSVLIMWLTTFGRHLTVSHNISKIVKVFRTKTHKGHQYTATILDDYSVENLSDFIHQTFFRRNSHLYQSNEKYITLSKN
ncbi:hypothetical protein [Fusobacterium massiliense]|uniref:hypothetical protein n=1 Tax=Fusobacterium massiliense TaxID=1852365 RepID=UPI00093A9BD1|nr:hypothetical protein [Fusobacterium massiliense]